MTVMQIYSYNFHYCDMEKKINVKKEIRILEKLIQNCNNGYNNELFFNNNI